MAKDAKRTGGDYKVGFGKPPRHTQFKPGRSGNPKGRPKGTRNLMTDLAEELRQKVPVTENGKRRALSKQQIMVKTLVTKAAKGDPRATEKVLDLMLRLIGVDADGARPDAEIGAADEALIADFLNRKLDTED